MTQNTEESTSYSFFEKLLAFVAIGMIILAVAAYLTTLIVALVAGSSALEENLWPIVTWIGYFGLPIGFIFLIALLITSYVRKGKRRQ